MHDQICQVAGKGSWSGPVTFELLENEPSEKTAVGRLICQLLSRLDFHMALQRVSAREDLLQREDRGRRIGSPHRA